MYKCFEIEILSFFIPLDKNKAELLPLWKKFINVIYKYIQFDNNWLAIFLKCQNYR